MLAALCAVLGGCATSARPELPIPIEIAIAASERLNPTEEGRPSPVVVRIYELSNQTWFQAADFFELIGMREAPKNEEILDMQEFIAVPGEVRVVRRRANLATRAIGVVTGYRDIDTGAWRSVVQMPPPHQAGRLWSWNVSPERRYQIILGERSVDIREVLKW
jgi:type VI secretion system protein VasD